jgi:hypothetical protein
LSWVIVTLSVDSSADNATHPARYVPVFTQTSIPKTLIMINVTNPINGNFRILLMIMIAPEIFYIQNYSIENAVSG